MLETERRIDPRTLGDIDMQAARVFLVYLVLLAVNQAHAETINFGETQITTFKRSSNITSQGQAIIVRAANSTFKTVNAFPEENVRWDDVRMNPNDTPITRTNDFGQTTSLFVISGNLSVTVGTLVQTLRPGKCMSIGEGKNYTIHTPQKNVRMVVKRVSTEEQ